MHTPTHMPMPIRRDTQKCTHIHALMHACAVSHKSTYVHVHAHRPTQTWNLIHARVEPTSRAQISSQPQINFSAGWL